MSFIGFIPLIFVGLFIAIVFIVLRWKDSSKEYNDFNCYLIREDGFNYLFAPVDRRLSPRKYNYLTTIFISGDIITRDNQEWYLMETGRYIKRNDNEWGICSQVELNSNIHKESYIDNSTNVYADYARVNVQYNLIIDEFINYQGDVPQDKEDEIAQLQQEVIALKEYVNQGKKPNKEYVTNLINRLTGLIGAVVTYSEFYDLLTKIIGWLGGLKI